MARNKWKKWTNNPLKSKMNVIGPVSKNEDVLLNEYKALRAEVSRMQSAAKKRIARSHAAGFVNLLENIDQVKQSYTKVKDFQRLAKKKQQEEIIALREVVTDLQTALDRPFSSLEGMRDYLEKFKKVNTRNPNNAEKTIIQAFYDKFRWSADNNESNLEANKSIQQYEAHLKVEELMDAIDADTTLTDDEKEDLQRFLRQKLMGDKPDYDSQIPGMSIEEILEKYPEYQKYVRKMEQTAIAKFNLDSANLTNSPTNIF